MAVTVSEPLNSVFVYLHVSQKRDTQLSESEKSLECSQWLRTWLLELDLPWPPTSYGMLRKALNHVGQLLVGEVLGKR